MFHRKRNKTAFTLIELLVVVIIVAILAAVGIPLLSGNVDRARASEAEAGLGTIRTGMRAFFAEHSAFPVAGDPILANIGLKAGDLTGRFFADGAYEIASISGPCITVVGNHDNALAPRHVQVDGTNGAILIRSMQVGGANDGNIYSAADCSTGLLN